MAIATSSIYSVVEQLRQLVQDNIEADGVTVSVVLGHPAAASKGEEADDQQIGLFVYAVEPFEFGTSPSPEETLMVRLKLLITIFGANIDADQPAGENALKLLGQVVRILHQNPILAAQEIDGETVCPHLVMQPMKPETLNHLWSTQGDVPFQPSIAYDLSLVPIVPQTKTDEAPLAGELLFGSSPDLDDPQAYAAIQRHNPQIKAVQPNSSYYNWTPAIALIASDEEGQKYHQFYQVEKASDLNLEVEGETKPRVYIMLVGQPETQVSLEWQYWDSSKRWQSADAGQHTVLHSALDPQEAPPVADQLILLELPIVGKGQALLYPLRTAVNPLNPDQTTTVRGTPVLINIASQEEVEDE